MKTSLPAIPLLTTLLLAAASVTTHATDIVKTNNATALNATGSWVGGVVPTAADLAVFDATLDATPKIYNIGGNLIFNGISFRDAQSGQTIGATASSTLTLANGSPGITMTAAAISNLTVSCLLNLGTSGGQTFNVANSDRTLLVNAAISGTGPLTKTGAGLYRSSNNSHAYTGGTIVSGGTLQLGVNNGLAAGSVTVQSGATLDLNGFGLTNKVGYVVRIAGTGVGGNGALVNNGGTVNTALTNLILDADATVGGSGRFDMRPVAGGFPSVDLAGFTLTKVGAQQFWLQQLRVTSGNIVVETGTLGLNAMTYTNGGLLTVKSGANLTFFRNAAAAVSTLTVPMTWEAGALVNLNGTDTTDPIDQRVDSTIAVTGVPTVSVAAAGAVLELAGGISGIGGIIKSGPGSLLLSGAGTYSGDTTVSAGGLTLGSAWSGAGAVTVSDAATIAFQPATAGAIVNLSSLTLGTAGNTTANFNMGGFANPSGPVANVTNALTLNGTTTVNLASTSGLTGGTIKLITFGSIAGSGGFVVGTVPGFTATLGTNGNSIEITLQPATLSWRGNATGTWQVSNPAALDWFNLLSSAPAGFVDGLPVVFDDAGSATPNVNITETVQPANVVVSNVATLYDLTGLGKISGTASLTKTGAGTLNLGLANDYSGATTISQGTLKLGVPYAISTNTVSPALTLNGTLDLNGNNQIVNGLTGNGTLDNTSPTLATLTIGSTGTDSFTGVIQDTGGAGSLKIAKTSAGTLRLSGNNTFSGGLNINNGTLQLGSANALGSGLFSIAFQAKVSSDSTTARVITNSVSFGGTSTLTLGNAVNNGLLTFSGPVDFLGTANARNLVMDSDVVFSGLLSNGAMNKQGAGTMTMNGVGSHTGATVIQAGTLTGTGSFAGLVNIAAAGTFAPGPGIGAIGSMTITSNLFIANVASTINMEVNAANNTSDQVLGIFRVTYNGTLNVANLGGTFTNGQSFQLFSASETVGNFAATNLPALPGDLVWRWTPSSGTLSVVPPIATTPTNITFTATGSTLELTWPESHLGWVAQSNIVSVADANSWYDIAGSASATNLSITIDPLLPQVFYRLSLP